MARITVEDCLARENNRFNLVLLASQRAKQLLSGRTPVTDTRGNKAIVSALREIADGKVKFRPPELSQGDAGDYATDGAGESSGETNFSGASMSTGMTTSNELQAATPTGGSGMLVQH